MLSDYSLDLNSETMISFLEMENVQEVETVEKKQVFKEQVTRPSVIMKPGPRSFSKEFSKKHTFSRIHSRFRSGMESISCNCVKPTRTNETQKEVCKI